METMLALLLSVLAAPGDAVSQEELLAVNAALEEHFSSLRSIETRYVMTQVSLPKAKEVYGVDDLPPSYRDWAWQNGKQSYSRHGSSHAHFEWLFDGRRTYLTFFTEKDEINGVWIEPSSPRNDLLIDNALSVVLGLRTDLRPDGLISYWRQSRDRKSLRGYAVPEGIEFNLGKFEEHGFSPGVFLVVDPAHDYRIVSFRMEDPDHPMDLKGQIVPDVTRIQIDEFQLVTDESGGKSRWFPRRARALYPLMTLTLGVEALRINHEIPATTFTWREPPFGTEINEVRTPGRPATRYLVGGKAAEQQQLAKMTEAAQLERDRLDLVGVTFDATPRASSSVRYWMAMGIVFLAAASVAWWKRRAA